MDERSGRRIQGTGATLTRRRLLQGSLALRTAAVAAAATKPRPARAGIQDALVVEGKLVAWGYGTEHPVAAARVDAFRRAFPAIELEIVSELRNEDLLIADAAGAVPDLLWLDRLATAGWASRDVLLPLADLIERDGYDTGRYYEAGLAEASYDGRLYGIPGGMDLRVLYVNRDALLEIGVDPAGVDPANWDRLNELGAQLVHRDGDRVQRWGFDNKLGSGSLYLWGTGNGGNFLNGAGDETTFDDPKIVEALAWGVRGFDDQGGFHIYDAFSATVRGDEQFACGRVAMTMDGDRILGVIAHLDPRLDFAVRPVKPRGNGEGVASYTGGHAWYIPRAAKNPDAAWEFIKFLHTDETWLLGANALKAARRAEGRPFIPSLTGSRTADQVQLDWVYERIAPAFDEAVALFPQILAETTGRQISRSPAADLLHETLMDVGLLPALRKEKEPQPALEEANLAAQDVIDSL